MTTIYDKSKFDDIDAYVRYIYINEEWAHELYTYSEFSRLLKIKLEELNDDNECIQPERSEYKGSS